jgi:hypothetical protein
LQEIPKSKKNIFEMYKIINESGYVED